MRRDLALLGLTVAVLTAAGCSVQDWRDGWRRLPSPDDAVAQVSWFSVMHRGVGILPYKLPRPPVPGTVPVTGVEAPLPVTVANQAAMDAIKNPIAPTAASLARGQDRFTIFCEPCHGATAAGNGPVNQKLMVAPSLLTAKARGYTDGYIYSMLRMGRGIMPAYGDRIKGDDRWDVVNWVRHLQSLAPQGAAQ